MGQTTGTDVIKHAITKSSTAATTHTIVHDLKAGRSFAAAIRVNLPSDENDGIKITAMQRVPGRNSDTAADDYYDDEPVQIFGGSGNGIEYLRADDAKVAAGVLQQGNIFYVTAGTGKQHIISFIFPPSTSTMVIKVEEEGATSEVTAVTTWEVG